MAIVRALGKPSYFLTMTCNPNWPEIRSALRRGQQPNDRPDIINRVFHLKVKQLMKDLLEGQILGHVQAYFFTIEFQKRGLPHMHLLLIMHGEDKPNSAEKTDKAIWAEAPLPTDNETLFPKVKKHMVHGPCGIHNPACPCMEETDSGVKKCSKEFPKSSQKKTIQDGDTYPIYRRRSPAEGGIAFVKDRRGEAPFPCDNSWIVPFNAYLLQRFDCHINLENVHSIEAVKYLYKYLTKGPDRASFAEFQVGPDGKPVWDEITNYIDGRYVSATMACWRLFEFELHQKHPPVTKLPVHLPEEQTVLFNTMQEMQEAAVAQPDTKLTAYFQFMQSEGELAADIAYYEILQFTTWNGKEKRWQWRSKTRGPGFIDEKGRKVYMHLGRIPFFTPNREDQERFYLRMLLLERPAPSFEALRTVDGVTLDTFKEACVKLGLLDDDNEQDEIMQEVATCLMPAAIRRTFVSILLYITPTDCPAFFEKHLKTLSEDIRHELHLSEEEEEDELLKDHVRQMTLAKIKDLLETAGSNMTTFKLPEPHPMYEDDRPALLRREQIQDELELAALRSRVDQLESQLTDEQLEVYDEITDAFCFPPGQRAQRLFSLNACGGSGKTFILNLLLKKARSMGKVALAVAYSGIAATLLDGGCTIHSRFKVGFNGWVIPELEYPGNRPTI